MKRIALVLVVTACTSKNPLLAAEPADESFSGTVVTRLPAGGYTYLELERTGGRRTWVVTMSEAPLEGSTVTVTAYARAVDFESRRLRRRFAALLFAAVHPQS